MKDNVDCPIVGMGYGLCRGCSCAFWLESYDTCAIIHIATELTKLRRAVKALARVITRASNEGIVW
jgi:hypothetical protein